MLVPHFTTEVGKRFLLLFIFRFARLLVVFPPHKSTRANQRAHLFVHYIATPYQAHISAAKAGVDALSAVIAIEEGPHGIRSNVIAPGGIIGTEGMNRLAPTDNSLDWNKFMPVPAGRLGYIQDVANAAIFLFSPAAAHITGQVLPVDGGAEHLRMQYIPYPQGVLDPDSVSSIIKPKM